MRKGFTLAEVLITLTIIGVIAALTIPNLMRKWNDHADVQKVKQAYSILQHAFTLAVAEYGELDTWDWPIKDSYQGFVNGEYLGNILKDHLKVKYYCGNNFNDRRCSNNAGSYCGTCETYKLNSSTANGVRKHGYQADPGGWILMENGMYFAFYPEHTNNANYWFGPDGYRGYVMVDINGHAKPNKYGYDVFFFPYSPKGKFLQNTNYRSGSGVMEHSNCSSKAGTGESCALWVFQHGNMDYKYRDVSAEW